MLRKGCNPSILLSCIVCFYAVTVWSQSGQRCFIKSMIGDVKVQRSKSPKWIKARPNMPLKVNDAVRTFVESEAVIQFPDGGNISLKENTTLELSALSKEKSGAKKTGLKILSGDLMANVKKLTHKGSKFEFETPTAVAAIRGTRVGFNVKKEKTDIKVYEGRVYVVPKGARKGAELKSNEMTTVVKGQKKVTVKVMQAAENEETSSGDTTRQTDDTTSSVTDTTEDVKLTIKILSPENGQVFLPDAQVAVAGKVIPSDAVVRVRGNTVPVKPNGEFKVVIQGPREPGQYNVEIEASYKAQSTAATRFFIIKEMPTDLVLTVNEPNNNQVFNKPLIKVSGFVTPGAELTINGMAVVVPPNGNFSKEVPIPDEEGEIVLEIEASLKEKTKMETRTVMYKIAEGDVVISVQMPLDKQLVCDNRLQVRGVVQPATINEISVSGTAIPVRNGSFADMIQLPDEPGMHEVEFEVVMGSVTKSVRRMVNFDPVSEKCNTEIPIIQPSSLPLNTKTGRIAFTVYDKTPNDEITFYTSREGSKDSETGAPGARFFLELEEGKHKYEVWAEDLAGNKSQKVVGEVSYLVKDIMIRLNNPSGTYKLLHIPPSNPEGSFRPEFTVEFSVENLPDDDPTLLRKVQVLNRATGELKYTSNFTNDIDFDFDIELKRGRNTIEILVRDINDRDIRKEVVIEVR